MKGLFKYLKAVEDVEILVMLDGTIRNMEDIETTVLEELEDNYDVNLIKEKDILVYDSEEEMCILEEVNENDDCPDYWLYAVTYNGKRYTIKSLENALEERKKGVTWKE